MQSDSATPGPYAAAHASGSLGVAPLFHAAWLFALGVALTRAAWLRPSTLLVALLPVAVLCALAAVRAQRLIWLPVGVLWCLLGAWCAEMEPQPAPAPELRSLSDGLLRTVEGTIVDAAPVKRQLEEDLDQAAGEAQPPTQRIDLRVSAIEKVTDQEDIEVPVAGGARLTVRFPDVPDRPFHCGERVRAVARLLPPEVYRDPGAWSREEYLLGQGITATASLDTVRIERLGKTENASAFWGWLRPGAISQYLRCALSDVQRAASTRLLALPGATQRMPEPLR